MKVSKIRITTYFTPKGRKCRKAEAVLSVKGREVLRSGFEKVCTESTNYYGKYRNASGRVVREPLCPDKKASQEILAKLIADAAKARHGLRNPYLEHQAVRLADHLADFRRALESKGGTEAHRKQVISRLTRSFDGCGFECLEDLSSSKLEGWLSDQRKGTRSRVALAGKQEWFTMQEAAAILDVTPTAVRAMVSRHRLTATGRGKARRLPQATVEFLQDRRCRGLSVQTSNYIIVHAKAFGSFLVKNRRIAENPFAHLQKGRIEVDRRHDRRELTSEEMSCLLATTRASGRTFRGLSGEDRYFLYAVAASTGFRAAALASLTPANFQLDQEPASVVLAARSNKNRKPRKQPLPMGAVTALMAYLASKPSKQLIWGGTWAADHRGAEMIRKDLADAGIPYVTDGPDGPLFADFHSLRHTFITQLGRSGVDLRTSQELAGHGSPVQTARYSHRSFSDMAAAVQKLPNFLPATNVKSPEGTNLVCPRLDQTGFISGHRGSGAVSKGGADGVEPETTQPPIPQGFSQVLSASDMTVQKRG